MDIHKEPNIAQKAKNFGSAMINWAGDGFSKVNQDIFNRRKSICIACPLWDQSGFGGLGKCKACGCSVGKLYIPKSRCPLVPPKWNAE